MSLNKLILVTDGQRGQVRASSIQSVVEVARVEPAEAVRSLGANNWNVSVGQGLYLAYKIGTCLSS